MALGMPAVPVIPFLRNAAAAALIMRIVVGSHSSRRLRLFDNSRMASLRSGRQREPSHRELDLERDERDAFSTVKTPSSGGR